MGDRASISFSNQFKGWDRREVSPALFSHWGGMGFVNEAYAYVRKLMREIKAKKNSIRQPLDRLEPNAVLVDFIHYYTNEVARYQKQSNKRNKAKGAGPYYPNPDRIYSDLYLGQDENCGDNSDNGHHEIRLDEVKP